MYRLKKDIQFGLEQECKIINNIKVFFNDNNVVKDNDRYAPFDFIGDDCLYELKSRRVSHNTYPTTIFPKHKLDKTDNSNKKRILLFSFEDGLYYIEYDNDLFKTFKITKKSFRSDRCYNGVNIDKVVEYYEIPITNLKLVSV